MDGVGLSNTDKEILPAKSASKASKASGPSGTATHLLVPMKRHAHGDDEIPLEARVYLCGQG